MINKMAAVSTKKDMADIKKRQDYAREYYKQHKTKLIEQVKKRTTEKKESIRAYHKRYYELNKKKLTEDNRAYYQKHKHEIAEQRRKHYLDKKAELVRQAREYQEKNKEKIQQQKKQYYTDNKEKFAEYRKQYYEEHKLALRQKRKERYAALKQQKLSPEAFNGTIRRGRGRPRKAEIGADQPVPIIAPQEVSAVNNAETTKKKRGRPSKAVQLTIHPQETQEKAQSQEENLVVRRRGRPRKVQDASQLPAAAEVVAKRRGRPRKSEKGNGNSVVSPLPQENTHLGAGTTTPPAKRQRGRPKKEVK